MKGISHLDGSQWSDGCMECSCRKGVANCSISDNDISQICQLPIPKTRQNEGPQKCQLFNDVAGIPASVSSVIKEYHNGQKWLEKCQECECLVIMPFLPNSDRVLENRKDKKTRKYYLAIVEALE